MNYPYAKKNKKTLDEKGIFSGIQAQPPYEIKFATARVLLENLRNRFSREIDGNIFKELDRMAVLSEISFADQRSADHLAKIAFSTYFIRRKLSKNLIHIPFKDHLDIRIFPSSLRFTFASKPVLSILAHAYLKDKYEIFDEEQILCIIRKLLPEIQLVKDSVYTFQPSKNTIKTLYFEIGKKNGEEFGIKEIISLKTLLKEEIKFSIEQLVPRVFMIRNEEEVFKNILVLSREINSVSDLPQVMILFDQQTSQEVMFTIIFVRVTRRENLSIQECFQTEKISKLEDYEYTSDRCEIVRYLRKKHPVEANVFRIRLIKKPTLLRSDLSLNYYLARQKISHILTEVLGEFRDYNGGIIIKQREALASLKEIFTGVSQKDPDLLENFYYSIRPIEAQAILSIRSLTTLFKLFLEAQCAQFSKPSDFFVKFLQDQTSLFITLRTPDKEFKEIIDFILSKSVHGVVLSALSFQNTYSLGYFLTGIDTQTQEQLCQSIRQALNSWKNALESRQILRLCIEPPIVSLDPRIGGDQISAVVLKMLFEGLMRINRSGALEKGIAQNIEVSSDQKIYLFKLKFTYWSDGSPVSAYDFEYAWKKVLSPSFKTPFAYLFYPIKNAKLAKKGLVTADAIGVKALDNFTLSVELEFPSPYFLELTAHTIYSPVNHLVDQRRPDWALEDHGTYICNGAFQLKMNRFQEEYELTKNPLYWDVSSINLDEIKVQKANRFQAYEMFQRGLNHWVGAPLGTWDPSFVPHEKDELIVFPATNVFWFVFNTKVTPFHNKKIRKALSCGIDRSKLKKKFNILPAITPIHPLYSQLNYSVLSTFSLKEAQILFKEGLKELNMCVQDFPVIPLIYLIGKIRSQVAHFVKEQWEAAFGVRCSLEPLEWKLLFDKMTEGAFQVGGMSWESWIDDPIYTLNAFRDVIEPINFPKWENKTYQEVMQRAEREINLHTRKEYYLKAEQILLEEMPVIPLFLIEPTALKKKNLSTHYMDFKWGHFS